MSIYKRASGRYQVLIDLDRDATGRRVKKAHGTYRTRKEAEAAERKALEARERGEIVTEVLTIRDAMERYIARCRTANRAPKTVERYEEISRLHIVPNIGNIAIGKLKPTHISHLHTTISKHVSAKTVRHVHFLLNAVLAWAVDQEVAVRNVATKATKDLPKVLRSPAKALTDAQAITLLEAARGTPWEAFLAIALCTGARRSEIAALRWSAIDLERRCVTIKESLTRTKESGVTFKSTKTDTVRVVPLNDFAIEALRTQKERQDSKRRESWGLYRDDDLIFADPLGEPWNPGSISNAFARISRAAGIRVRLHDLRHTAATWMLQGGIDVRTVAGVLGHTDASTTLRTYSHVMPGATERAVEVISARLKPNPSGQPNGNRRTIAIQNRP